MRQKPAVKAPNKIQTSAKKKELSTTAKETQNEPTENKKLSFNEQHELKNLPIDIEKLETRIAELEVLMSDPDFFSQEHKKVSSITDELQQSQVILKEKYDRWEELEA